MKGGKEGSVGCRKEVRKGRGEGGKEAAKKERRKKQRKGKRKRRTEDGLYRFGWPVSHGCREIDVSTI